MKAFFLFLMKLLLAILFFSGTIAAQDHFPEDWLGNYTGKMSLTNLVSNDSTSREMSQLVDVEFIFEEEIPDSVWTYQMIYHSESFGDITKDYKIRVLRENNDFEFIFDENNGILMSMTLLNNVLFGMYEVLGQFYFTSLRQTSDNGLFFELMAASGNDPLISGTMDSDEESITATSYKPIVCQSVQLHKN